MEFYCDIKRIGNIWFLYIDDDALSGEPFELLGLIPNRDGLYEFDGSNGFRFDRNGSAYSTFDSRENVIKMIDYLNDRFNYLNDINLESIVLEFD